MAYILAAFIISLSIYIEAISVKLVPETGTPPSSRELPGFTIDPDHQKLYVYGGITRSRFGDMWEFDLLEKRWDEIHPVSVLKPGSRSNPFLVKIRNQRKLVLFGGDTSYGPVSDLWLYDIDQQSVIFIQWKIIDENGTPPPRAFYRAVCGLIHEDKQYIAVYGGEDKDQFNSRLYLYILYSLDLQTFTWMELPSLGNAPLGYFQKLDYSKGCLYLLNNFGSEYGQLYKYEIFTGNWTILKPSDKKMSIYSNCNLCFYNDHLYSFIGDTQGQLIYKIKLEDESYILEENLLDRDEIGLSGNSYGYACKNNLMYIFGGVSVGGYYNSLALLDFDQYPLKFSQLSKLMYIPTARRGHAMEVYNNNLYIYGGIAHGSTQ